MTRLVDRLLASPVSLPAESSMTPEAHRDLVASIKKDLSVGSDDTGGLPAPSLVIDNVADFVFADPTQRFEVADFPNAAPPWAVAWYEYRVPAAVRAATRGAKEMGYWVAAFLRDEGGWELKAFLFGLPPGDQEVMGPMQVHTVDIAVDGTVEKFAPSHGFGGDDLDNAYRTLSFLVPVLMANSFAHCRNVSDEVVTPPPRLSKAFRRRHGRDLSKYHVLVIDPMREVLRREGGSDKVGAIRALHICRGHFKTFDERPLFGRMRGTYWWSPQVRGRAEAGVVRKDYRVRLARGDDAIHATPEPSSATRTGAYASPELARAVEDFSVAKAVAYLQRSFPGAAVEVLAHSNPGYDIRVGTADNPVRFVEVKGTSRDVPEFFLSEGERQFSIDHAERYTLILVDGIDLDADGFDLHVHDGAVEESFALRPVQWRARALDSPAGQ